MLAAPDLFCQAMPCGAIAGRSGRQDPRVRRELSMDVAGPANTRPLREELLRLFDDRISFETCLEALPCPAKRHRYRANKQASFFVSACLD